MLSATRKRKRGTPDARRVSPSTATDCGCRPVSHCVGPTGVESLPLTEENLELFDTCDMFKKRKVNEDQPGKGSRTPSTSTHRTYTSEDRLERHRIYVDRGVAPPETVSQLINHVKRSRDIDITPKSKSTAKNANFTARLLEDEAIQCLQDVIGYRGEMEVSGAMGEPGIFRTRNRLFNVGTLPLIDGGDDEFLAVALEQAGIPSQPKPDFAYGYLPEAFDQRALSILKTLPLTCLVYKMQPLMPYWVVEWKTQESGGTMKQAKIQATRDGAAAVNAMFNLYETLGQTSPDPAATAVFSTRVDSETVETFVHWRHIGNTGEVSFEAKRVDSAFLYDEKMVFAFRGTLHNILAWAVGPRLKELRKILGECEAQDRRSIVLGRISPTKKDGGKRDVQNAGDDTTQPVTPPHSTSDASCAQPKGG